MGKNKAIQKLTAMMLSIIMVVGMTPVSALAETGGLPIGASGEITAFEELATELAVQNVPLGTSKSDLELPGVLIATVQLASLEEDAMDSGETDSEADSTDTVSGAAISIEESSDTHGETGITPAKEEAAEGASTDEPSEITIPLPVIWESSPAYDGDTKGEYTFVPKLPEGFVPAVGVELPTITVMVSEGEVPVFATRGTSTSLPNGSEYPETVGGLGTEEDPLRIETAAQLAAFSWSVNHGSLPVSLPDYPYLILVNDINLSDYVDEDSYGKGWVPIGGYYNEDTNTYAFSGTFDGNHKTILGLYIERDERYVGLFGYVKEGVVKKLTVEGGDVTGYAATGGIVGVLYNGRLENCVFSGSVTGEEDTGGIVGYLGASKMEDCKNTGSITGKIATGGIVGGAGSDGENDYLRNCINTGAVTGEDGLTGGIAGLLVGMTADYCVNTGTVQGGTDLNTGGVAGTISEGIIQNCVNGGPVSGSANNIGGLAGLVRSSTIQNCINYADVSGTTNSVGGVAGFAEEGSAVTNCLTTGNIRGEVNIIEPGGVSGVVGRLQKGSGGANTLSGCVALGQTVIKDGEMGNVARIAAMDPRGNTSFDNFAWSGMQLWYDGELFPEEDYSHFEDGENADAAVLQTLWMTGELAESWSEAEVWTLAEGKLPVLTGLPHQSDKFPSYISGISGVTISPDSTSVQKGTTKGFASTVTGIGAFDDTVTWSVSGGMAGTTIDSSGMLTVAADETAATLIVTATATGDSSKKSTASVTVTDPPVIKYALTVNSGFGSGEYAEGANVTITAAVPAENKLFDKWIVTSGTLVLSDATANPITITMPAEAIVIGATYKDKPVGPDPTYIVTLSGGGSGVTGAGSYAEGTTINIYAGNRSGYTFTSWTSSDVAITNASSKNASFTMPSKAVTVAASWSYNGGGGSGSSSDNNSNIIITPPAQDKPNTPTQAEIKVDGKVDTSGNLTVAITDKNITDAINKAIAEAKKNGNEANGVTLVLNVSTGGKTVHNIIVNLPKTVQDTIISKKIVSTIVVVDNPNIKIDMDLSAIKEINKQANADVNITATRMDSGNLTGNAKIAIGSRPIFDFKVNYGSGQVVQSFGAGSVSVAIPYTLGANEKAGNVQAVYVDASGKVQWLMSSVYDSANKVLRFSTSHFSTYGVGYKQDAPSFSDIDGHWAKDDIEFVVSRGLFSGTSATTFSPNTAMTRGMFVTSLGRLANADVSAYKQSSFTDVKSDAYYMGYIEWANKNNIVTGIGDGKFAPDQSITREQMAVIISNYAKTIGFTLPKVHAENIFTDSAKVSAYAKAAVKTMQMAGVISGKSGNIFDPQGTATRAEVSAVLRRLVELVISSDTAQGWTRNDSGQWMYYENGNPVTGKKNIDGVAYTFDQYGVMADVPKNLKYTTYTVQKGDSFWRIAHKLGCTMSELERLNNKSRFYLIHPGDVLRVPEK